MISDWGRTKPNTFVMVLQSIPWAREPIYSNPQCQNLSNE